MKRPLCQTGKLKFYSRLIFFTNFSDWVELTVQKSASGKKICWHFWLKFQVSAFISHINLTKIVQNSAVELLWDFETNCLKVEWGIISKFRDKPQCLRIRKSKADCQYWYSSFRSTINCFKPCYEIEWFVSWHFWGYR